MNFKQFAKEKMKFGLKYADILKISEIELELLTGTPDLHTGSKALVENGSGIVLVTLGPKGCYYRTAKNHGHMHTYDTKVVDTTGSGDAFLGGFLYLFNQRGLKPGEIDDRQILEIVDFANANGALCATKKGAIPAMPYLEEVGKCMENVPKLLF